MTFAQRVEREDARRDCELLRNYINTPREKRPARSEPLAALDRLERLLATFDQEEETR